MSLLHDPVVRDSICARVDKLGPDTPHRWGKMSVDQMLWHVNRVLANALGEFQPADMEVPIPRGLAKFLVLSLPWPKGAPTQPWYVARERYPFEAERDRCLRLIDEFTSRGIDSTSWGRSAAFGDMTGRDWSRLNAKHVDHHLKQFGV
jgi:DinB family protein